MAWGLGGVGWCNNVDITSNLKWCYARATWWLGVWVGWGGAITFMLLAISSDATLGLRHGLGFGCGVGWGNNVDVTCNLKSMVKQTLGRLKQLMQKWKTTIVSKPQNPVNTMKSLQHYSISQTLLFPKCAQPLARFPTRRATDVCHYIGILGIYIYICICTYWFISLFHYVWIPIYYIYHWYTHYVWILPWHRMGDYKRI